MSRYWFGVAVSERYESPNVKMHYLDEEVLQRLSRNDPSIESGCVDLSEAYLKNAGRIAHERAAFAALRLAAVWLECLPR